MSSHLSETADSILSDSISINKNAVILTPTSIPISLPVKAQQNFQIFNKNIDLNHFSYLK